MWRRSGAIRSFEEGLRLPLFFRDNVQKIPAHAIGVPQGEPRISLMVTLRRQLWRPARRVLPSTRIANRRLGGGNQPHNMTLQCVASRNQAAHLSNPPAENLARVNKSAGQASSELSTCDDRADAPESCVGWRTDNSDFTSDNMLTVYAFLRIASVVQATEARFG